MVSNFLHLKTAGILGIFLASGAMRTNAADFESLYRQALEQRKRKLGKTAAKTIESARDLALYLAARGEVARAAPYLPAALAAASTLDAATVLHNWGVAVDDPTVAEKLYRKALEIRSKALPASDVDLATTRLNLADLLMRRGDPGAGALAIAALGALDKLPFDIRTGAACGLVGAVLATRGDVAGAERMFRRSLAIAEKSNGDIASALENLADLLSQTGRESAAQPLLDRAGKLRAGSR
jgi:tetratricopeptide (TPR) repeat protein